MEKVASVLKWYMWGFRQRYAKIVDADTAQKSQSGICANTVDGTGANTVDGTGANTVSSVGARSLNDSHVWPVRVRGSGGWELEFGESVCG